MRDVFVKVDEPLLSVAQDFEMQLRAGGNDWKVCVDSRLAGFKSPSNFGGSGSALLIGLVASEFRCKYAVLESERIILLY